MSETTLRIGKRIANINDGDGNALLLMMQDFMYFDTMPDEYKEIINKVFECEYPSIDDE